MLPLVILFVVASDCDADCEIPVQSNQKDKIKAPDEYFAEVYRKCWIPTETICNNVKKLEEELETEDLISVTQLRDQMFSKQSIDESCHSAKHLLTIVITDFSIFSNLFS